MLGRLDFIMVWSYCFSVWGRPGDQLIDKPLAFSYSARSFALSWSVSYRAVAISSTVNALPKLPTTRPRLDHVATPAATALMIANILVKLAPGSPLLIIIG